MKGPSPFQKKNRNDIFRNNKRVAEIWLEEYKQYFYSRNPERYRNLQVDIGDISQQLNLKKSLGCKPFSYFINNIALGMLERFPLVDFENFASGTVSLESKSPG